MGLIMINYGRTPKKQNTKKSLELDSNILIVGMPGCGKSSIAPILAAFLGFGVLNFDQWITTTTGLSPKKIINTHDVEYFHNIEYKTLSSIINIKNHVIDLGGGSISTQKLFLKAKSLGILVWIDTSIDIITERMLAKNKEITNRPLLNKCVSLENRDKKKDCIKNILKSIFYERKKFYQRADLIVNANFSNSSDIVNRIIKLIH
jgi:shikimate kinase